MRPLSSRAARALMSTLQMFAFAVPASTVLGCLSAYFHIKICTFWGHDLLCHAYVVAQRFFRFPSMRQMKFRMQSVLTLTSEMFAFQKWSLSKRAVPSISFCNWCLQLGWLIVRHLILFESAATNYVCACVCFMKKDVRGACHRCWAAAGRVLK